MFMIQIMTQTVFVFDEELYENQQHPMNLNMGFNLRVLHVLRMEHEEELRQQIADIQVTHPWQYRIYYFIEYHTIVFSNFVSFYQNTLYWKYTLLKLGCIIWVTNALTELPTVCTYLKNIFLHSFEKVTTFITHKIQLITSSFGRITCTSWHTTR